MGPRTRRCVPVSTAVLRGPQLAEATEWWILRASYEVTCAVLTAWGVGTPNPHVILGSTGYFLGIEKVMFRAT